MYTTEETCVNLKTRLRNSPDRKQKRIKIIKGKVKTYERKM